MRKIIIIAALLLGMAGVCHAGFYTRIPYQNVAGKMQVKVSVEFDEGIIDLFHRKCIPSPLFLFQCCNLLFEQITYCLCVCLVLHLFNQGSGRKVLCSGL